MDKVHVSDRGSRSRSVPGANKASFSEETASPFGRAAARRAAVRDFLHGPANRWQNALAEAPRSNLDGEILAARREVMFVAIFIIQVGRPKSMVLRVKDSSKLLTPIKRSANLFPRAKRGGRRVCR